MDFGSLNDGVIAVEQIALESPTPTPRNAMWHSFDSVGRDWGERTPAGCSSTPRSPVSQTLSIGSSRAGYHFFGGSSADRQRNQDLQVATAIDRLHSQGHSIILAHGLLAGELAD